MIDLRNVYILTYGRYGSSHQVDGKQAAFTTREKGAAFRKALGAKGIWLQRVTLCQSEVCVPAVVDPPPPESVQRRGEGGAAMRRRRKSQRVLG